MHLPSVVEPWHWYVFTGAIVALLMFDLFIIQRKSHKPSFKEAAAWSVFWVGLALGFNLWFAHQHGVTLGLEFFTGYIVELSLSVDNLFVILLIFKSFQIPAKYQHRVLFWGILGAVIFRAVLIIVGVDLINKFHWIMYVFGLILLVSGAKFLFETDEEKDITDQWAVRLLRRFVPMTPAISGEHFFVRENKILKATPLFVALVVIEVTDIIFAVDSIPAVLAVTQDAFVAFGSNILAILGLRSLYFLIADLVGKVRYLKPGLACVLGFIGIKMLIMDLYHIPSTVSLMVILGILTTAALGSWYANRKSVLTSKK